jgi:aerobic-type carbon monoxide dehydrogenase small subunit (CoxS/CutS family)
MLLDKADYVYGNAITGEMHLWKHGNVDENKKIKNRVLGFLCHDTPYKHILRYLSGKGYNLIPDDVATEALKEDQSQYMQTWSCSIEECKAHGIILKDVDTAGLNVVLHELNEKFKPALIGEITNKIPPKHL